MVCDIPGGRGNKLTSRKNSFHLAELDVSDQKGNIFCQGGIKGKKSWKVRLGKRYHPTGKRRRYSNELVQNYKNDQRGAKKINERKKRKDRCAPVHGKRTVTKKSLTETGARRKGG